MQGKLLVTDESVARYIELFVNRRAYTQQSSIPHPETGRYYYYRPKGSRGLSRETIRQHLEGQITIGLYAINPKTQRCKWAVIDADYDNALEDLLKLQWELRQDGVQAALEKSRRGGHLWIFAAKPLQARDCRVYICNLAKRLKVPVKGVGLADGIEVFPKQNEVPLHEFGNAIRGPLGVHRRVNKRFWYYGADYLLEDQLSYLTRLKRITEEEMAGFMADLKMPEDPEPKPAARTGAHTGPANRGRSEFRILDHVTAKRKSGRNYWTRCPSCMRLGHDKACDNLAISILDPRKYRCWAGCTKEMIRDALGCPIRILVAS